LADDAGLAYTVLEREFLLRHEDAELKRRSPVENRKYEYG
jgi:hypothetical protein